jgi:hypothetical protein
MNRATTPQGAIPLSLAMVAPKLLRFRLGRDA